MANKTMKKQKPKNKFMANVLAKAVKDLAHEGPRPDEFTLTQLADELPNTNKETVRKYLKQQVEMGVYERRVGKANGFKCFLYRKVSDK